MPDEQKVANNSQTYVVGAEDFVFEAVQQENGQATVIRFQPRNPILHRYSNALPYWSAFDPSIYKHYERFKDCSHFHHFAARQLRGTGSKVPKRQVR